ncbi:MAG: DUF6596 domain-containing protein, partial [Nocardioidaceae bacterium]
RSTRFDVHGDLVPMEEQDRSRWDAALMKEGQRQLRRAARSGNQPGSYRLQAQIAACQCHGVNGGGHRLGNDRHSVRRAARCTAVTRDRVEPSHRRRLPRRLRSGLAELDELDATTLAGYYLLPSARADFLRRLGRIDEAQHAYRVALSLSSADQPERRLLQRRLAELYVAGRSPRSACYLERRGVLTADAGVVVLRPTRTSSGRERCGLSGSRP